MERDSSKCSQLGPLNFIGRWTLVFLVFLPFTMFAAVHWPYVLVVSLQDGARCGPNEDGARCYKVKGLRTAGISGGTWWAAEHREYCKERGAGGLAADVLEQNGAPGKQVCECLPNTRQHAGGKMS